MTGEVRELDGATVDRIAAGEVVERPAAAVKELVENSLDAGADRIEVTVEGDGTDLLRVADDGHGMAEADARRAVRKHTTSKIRDPDDLAAVASLGFRGEALYAIGAVSRMTVTTCPAGGEATELQIEGGEVVAVEPAGHARGTTVAVEDLFFNTPARRKYLKREATEFGHVNRVVSRYALANPGVAVSLEHDDREVFATTGRGELREAVLEVYGREVATSMVAVEATPDGPVERVGGYVSDPEVTRSTRRYLATFVNGRYVDEATLREAALAGYGDQLAPDRFPFAALFVEVPPGSVDANVHPRKMEVRFDEEAAVREAVEAAVREALLAEGLVREGAPRGRSAPEETAVEPAGTGEAGADTTATADREPTTGGHGELSTDTAPDEPVDGAADTDSGPNEPADGPSPSAGREPSGSAPESSGSPAADPGGSGGSSRFRGPTENARLADSAGESRAFDQLPAMRVLGQVEDTYLVAEADSGLVLVDQHAADERLNYERLAAALADGPDGQRLVEPAELELTAGEAAALEDATDELAELGFEATRDGRTVRVTAVPAALADQLEPDRIRDVLVDVLEDRADEGGVAAAADDLLADMACAPAITGGTSLSEGSAVGLLEALDDCANPYTCPHGRPVVVEVSESELAERFERDYPGHRTRRPEDG